MIIGYSIASSPCDDALSNRCCSDSRSSRRAHFIQHATLLFSDFIRLDCCTRFLFFGFCPFSTDRSNQIRPLNGRNNDNIFAIMTKSRLSSCKLCKCKSISVGLITFTYIWLLYTYTFYFISYFAIFIFIIYIVSSSIRSTCVVYKLRCKGSIERHLNLTFNGTSSTSRVLTNSSPHQHLKQSSRFVLCCCCCLYMRYYILSMWPRVYIAKSILMLCDDCLAGKTLCILRI